MSTITAAYGANSPSLSISRAISTLTRRQDALQTATATGLQSETYAGLGSSRAQALSLQPAITQAAAWSSNITAVQSKLTTTQAALGSIQTIASSLTTSLITLEGTPSQPTINAAVTTAKTALNTLGGLLNTRSGDDYVFAGTKGTIAPVSQPNLATSDLSARISDIVNNGLMSDGNDILSQTLGLAQNTVAESPFSSNLSVSPKVAASRNLSVSIGSGLSVTAGMTATQGTSEGQDTTGSPVRDLMRNLMVVASLGSSAATSLNYQFLIKGLAASNTQVTTDLTDMASALGSTQDQLTFQSGVLSTLTTSLKTQLGNAENIDYAATSVALTQTQTQLQASYSLVADMKGMTLASYI